MPETNPQTPTAPETAPAPGQTPTWRDAVAPEHRKVAEKFLSPADVVRSYAELERKLGGAITPPVPDAPPEERERFYERLGRPKRAEDYAVTLPSDLPEVLKPDDGGRARQQRFLAAAHKAGLTQAQVQAAIDWYYAELGSVHGEFARSGSEQAGEEDAALRREWGRDYDRNLEYGRRAMAQFGDERAVDELERAVGTPAVLRMMARIGRALGEAGTMSTTMTNGRADGLKQELTELFKTKDYWSNDRTQRRVREIHEELYPKHPVGGPGDRGI